MRWEVYNKRANRISLKTSDRIFGIVVIGDIAIPLTVVFGAHFVPLIFKDEITKNLSVALILGWAILTTIFFLWMFMDVSGNKHVRDKNGWLGMLYLASIYAAPVYYWVVYRKSRISTEQFEPSNQRQA